MVDSVCLFMTERVIAESVCLFMADSVMAESVCAQGDGKEW